MRVQKLFTGVLLLVFVVLSVFQLVQTVTSVASESVTTDHKITNHTGLTWRETSNQNSQVGDNALNSFIRSADFYLDSQDNQYIFFQDKDYNFDYSLMRLNGSTWEYVGQPGIAAGADFIIDGNDKLYVGFKDSANGDRHTIQTFNGTDWVTVGGPISTANGFILELAVDTNGDLYVLNMAAGSQNEILMYDGSNWVTVASSFPYSNNVFDFIVSQGVPYRLIYDFNPGHKVQEWTGSIWQDVGGVLAPANTGRLLTLDNNGDPVVVFQSSAGLDVLRYDGTTWNSLGGTFGTSPAGRVVDIEFDSSNTPYLSTAQLNEINNVNVFGATTYQYDGTNWNIVGEPSYSGAVSSRHSLAIDSRGGILSFYTTTPELDEGTIEQLHKVHAVSVDEKLDFSVDIEAATEGTDSSPVYSVQGGVDQALFTVEASTGLVEFISQPTYEDEADSDGDNIFEVVVRASESNDTSDYDEVYVLVKLLDNTLNATPQNLITLENSSITFNPLEGILSEINEKFSLCTGSDQNLQASNGVVALDGTNLVYTPNPGYIGSDALDYTVCSAAFGSELDELISFENIGGEDLIDDYIILEFATDANTLINDNCETIGFYNDDATTQLESLYLDGCQTQATRFLIRIDSIPVSERKNIYVDYDNTNQSIEPVFDILYDFEDNDISPFVSTSPKPWVVQDTNVINGTYSVRTPFDIDNGDTTSLELDLSDNEAHLVRLLYNRQTDGNDYLNLNVDGGPNDVLDKFDNAGVEYINVFDSNANILNFEFSQNGCCDDWNHHRYWIDDVETKVIDLFDITNLTTEFNNISRLETSRQVTGTIDVSIIPLGADGDDDGVPNGLEAQSPNNGDGNNDGTQDMFQSDVVAIPSTTEDYIVIDGNGCDLSNVSIILESELPQEDSGYDYPHGLVDFVGNCATMNVDIYLFSGENALARKYNGDYSTIDNAITSTIVIDSQEVQKAEYQINDGDSLDASPAGDNIIRDPFGFGVQVSSPDNLIRTGG